jgi:hypothetical protein
MKPLTLQEILQAEIASLGELAGHAAQDTETAGRLCLSFGSDIHSRMIFRRVSCSGFMLKNLCSKRWSTAA